MQQFSIDLSKLRRFKFWGNVNLWFYLLAELGVLYAMTIPFFNGSKWLVGPEWKIVYYVVWSSIAGLIIFTGRLISIFNNYCNTIQDRFSNLTVTIEAGQLTMYRDGISIKENLNEVVLTNHVTNMTLKNPFFGHGILHVKGNKQYVIPCMLFDLSVGAFKVRELLGKYSNYEERKISPKKLVVFIATGHK
jgi:hypothetical protein